MNTIELAQNFIDNRIKSLSINSGSLLWYDLIELVANEVSIAISERQFEYAVDLIEALEITLITKKQ